MGYIDADDGAPVPVPSRGFYTGNQSVPVRPATSVGGAMADQMRPAMPAPRSGLSLPERSDNPTRRQPAAVPQTPRPADAPPRATPRDPVRPTPVRPGPGSGRRAGSTATPPTGKGR